MHTRMLKRCHRHIPPKPNLPPKIGCARLFNDARLTDGSYIDFSGLSFSGGTNDQDADYFYGQRRLKF